MRLVLALSVLLLLPVVAATSGPVHDEPWAIPPQSPVGALGSDGHASFLFGGQGTTEVGGARSTTIHRLDDAGISTQRATLPVAIGGGAALWTGRAFVVLSSDAQGVPAAAPFVYDPATDQGHALTLPPSTFVYGADSAVWDGERVDVLGSTSDGHVDRLDPATGALVAGATMPAERHGGAAAFDPRATSDCPRGCAYLVGDAACGGCEGVPVVRYDPAGDRATLLDARWPGGGVAHAAWDGREILVVSGTHVPNARENLFTVRAFDPSTGAFRVVTTLPPLQGGLSIAWRDGALDVIVMRACPSCSNSLLRLDPTTSIATMISGQMLDAYMGDSSAVLDGKLYLLGGGTGSISTAIARFEIATGVEELLPASLPAGTRALSAAALDGAAYALVANGSAVDLVRFDPRTMDVATIGSLASSDRPARLVATSSNLLALGGSGVDLVDTRTAALTPLAGADPVLRDLAVTAPVWDGARVDLVGAEDCSAFPCAVTGDVVTFDPATRAFAKGATLPHPITEPSLAFDGARVLVVGGCHRGCNSKDYSTTIMTIDPSTGKTGELAARAPSGLLGAAVGADARGLLVVGGAWVDRPWDAVVRFPVDAMAPASKLPRAVPVPGTLALVAAACLVAVVLDRRGRAP